MLVPDQTCLANRRVYKAALRTSAPGASGPWSAPGRAVDGMQES